MHDASALALKLIRDTIRDTSSSPLPPREIHTFPYPTTSPNTLSPLPNFQHVSTPLSLYILTTSTTSSFPLKHNGQQSRPQSPCHHPPRRLPRQTRIPTISAPDNPRPETVEPLDPITCGSPYQEAAQGAAVVVSACCTGQRWSC